MKGETVARREEHLCVFLRVFVCFVLIILCGFVMLAAGMAEATVEIKMKNDVLGRAWTASA